MRQKWVPALPECDRGKLVGYAILAAQVGVLRREVFAPWWARFRRRGGWRSRRASGCSTAEQDEKELHAPRSLFCDASRSRSGERVFVTEAASARGRRNGTSRDWLIDNLNLARVTFWEAWC